MSYEEQKRWRLNTFRHKKPDELKVIQEQIKASNQRLELMRLINNETNIRVLTEIIHESDEEIERQATVFRTPIFGRLSTVMIPRYGDMN